MAENMFIVVDNDLETATHTTTGSFVAGLTPDNFTNEDKSFVMRTSAASDFYVEYTWGAPIPLNSVALAQYNFDANTSIRVRIWNTDDTGLTPVYDSGATGTSQYKLWGIDWEWGIDGFDSIIDEGVSEDISLLTFDTVGGKKLRIDFTDSTNADGYTQVGRAFVGQGFQPRVNASWGLQFTDVDDTIHSRAQDGLWANKGNHYRQLEFALEWLNDSEHMTLRSDLKRRGRHQDIMVIVYPDEYEAKKNMYAIIGKLSENVSFNHNFFCNYVSNYVLMEN